MDPHDSNVLYGGGAGHALFKTTNGAASWTPLTINANVTALLVDPENSRVVYAGTDGHGVYKSTNGGASFTQLTVHVTNPFVGPGVHSAGSIAVDPKNPNIFYAGSQGALVTRFDRSTSHIRDIQVYPLFFSGQSAGTLKERWQWTFPIVFSPHDPNTLYAAGNAVFVGTS
jgi:hypothetical protein